MYHANGRFGHGESSFFVCCGHTERLFLSSVPARRVCTAPHDCPEGMHERDASTLRGGSFDLFPQDRTRCREWRTHRVRNPFISCLLLSGTEKKHVPACRRLAQQFWMVSTISEEDSTSRQAAVMMMMTMLRVAKW